MVRVTQYRVGTVVGRKNHKTLVLAAVEHIERRFTVRLQSSMHMAHTRRQSARLMQTAGSGVDTGAKKCA
jgi:hypothetical protein